MYKVAIEVKIVKRAVITSEASSVERAVEDAKQRLRSGVGVDWGHAEVDSEIVDVIELGG